MQGGGVRRRKECQRGPRAPAAFAARKADVGVPFRSTQKQRAGAISPAAVAPCASVWQIGFVFEWYNRVEIMMGWLAECRRTLAVTKVLLVSALLGTSSQGCAAQTAIQTWEGRQDSVQQTRRSAGPRTAEREAAARAALQRLHATILSDNVFDPSLLAQQLYLSISERSGRFSPTSPEFVTLRPTQQDTPITSVSLILKPESGRVFRGSEIRISLSSEHFGCMTLADVTATFGRGYEPATQLPFQPPWPVEIPIDVAVYRFDGPPRRVVSFNYRFLDCLGSIEVLELLR